MIEPTKPGYYWVRVGPLATIFKREDVGKYADRSPWFSIDYEGSVPWSELAKADAIEPVAPPSWTILDCHCGSRPTEPREMLDKSGNSDGWYMECTNPPCETWVEMACSRDECVEAWNSVQLKAKKQT